MIGAKRRRIERERAERGMGAPVSHADSVKAPQRALSVYGVEQMEDALPERRRSWALRQAISYYENHCLLIRGAKCDAERKVLLLDEPRL